MALPAGWGRLGPVMDDPLRGSVEIDPVDCSVHVATVDLDGGAYHHDVRAARVWDGKGWRWADDWVVRDGQLLRPGRAPTPAASWPGVLEVDKQGRVVSRTVDGRRIEVLRGDDGRFRGMRAGSVGVELAPTEATAPGGRVTTYTYTFARIDAVQGAAGRVVYGYEGEALRTVTWPDGSALRIEADGTSGWGGRWRCTRTGTSTTIEGPGARRWTVSREADDVVTTDPAGAVMRSHWAAGRLLGWTDADGRRAELRWSAEGPLEELRQDGDRIAALRWGAAGLLELRDRFEGVWRLTRTPDGVEDRVDPDGRTVHRELTGGAPRVWRRGSESATVLRDGAGRPIALKVGSQGEVRLERGANGEITRVFDAAGGTWTLDRDARGLPTTLVDAAGTRWELKFDTAGRLVTVTPPDAQRTSLTRAEGRLTMITVGASRWTWLRDPQGALSGIRDPEGALTGLARDPAGRVVSVRRPDGTSLTLGRDSLGRLRNIGGWRLSRDAAGRVLEVRAAGEAVGGWSRDGAGRVTGFGMGEIDFTVVRDAAGRVSEVRAGEAHAERWRIDRDAAGRTSAVTTADGRVASVLRDSSGWVTRLTDELGATTLLRDLRGRISRVTADRTWIVSRDVVGRLVRQEVDGIGIVGADYEPDGGLAMLRLPDGTLVRRNTSRDAGELLATDRRGGAVGSAGWTLDGAGRLLSLTAGGAVRFVRDPAGSLMGVTGPSGEWTREAGVLRLPGGGQVRVDAAGRPTDVTLTEAGPWGLDPGAATYRWSAGGRLGGLDGPAGGAVLVHDGLGRPAALTLGERAVPLLRDAFGRLRRVGADTLVGWDGLLAVGAAPRAPFGAAATARPGGAVFMDPRGYPLLVPFAGALLPWPGGWSRGPDAAEAGAGGRYVLPGGVLVDLLRATDPLSGAATAPDRWPWTPPDVELGAAPSPFAAPDAATDAWWDAAPFDPDVGWADGLLRLVQGGLLPGGAPEPEEAPGLPWLPRSFVRAVPAPVSGHGAIGLDEDVSGRLVLRSALAAEPLTTERIVAAFLADTEVDPLDTIPGSALPGPLFAQAPLADSPFGH